METKLVKKNKLAIIPAGIVEGIEGFWYDGKWVLMEGRAMPFHESPGRVQRMFAEACMNDKRRMAYARKKGITKFSEVFDWWYRCVVGGLDHVPDFLDGKFQPDAFNNLCTNYSCEDRGKWCSVEAGLKSHEVKTIVALKRGKSMAETANELHVSCAGMKSRVEKIKTKLGTSNMASMMARATEIGI